MKTKFSKWIVSLGMGLLLGGCAGQKPKMIYPPPTKAADSTPLRPGGPQDPTSQLPPALPEGQTEALKKETTGITLVVGGAGVASFAVVGLLKRFHEEGIKVDGIVTTGWPTLFAISYGFTKTVHDVEWFATRLQEKDFYSVGIFDSTRDFASHDKLSGLIQGAFKQKDLRETRIPVVISSANTELGDSETIDTGDWQVPLLKTMSVPGVFRPYPEKGDSGWVNSLEGIDVDEAVRRSAKKIVAVEMYEDYFNFVKSRGEPSDRVFRKLYLAQLKKGIAKQMKQAAVTGSIVLGKPALDFSQKRNAILAGYREGMRLAKLVRSLTLP